VLIREIFFDATYSLPTFPKITSDGKGYVVFHELYYALISEVRRTKDNKLVDIAFMFYDYPYSIDITEFEV
jgi:Ca2+-binding EF-hand superfamily protein